MPGLKQGEGGTAGMHERAPANKKAKRGQSPFLLFTLSISIFSKRALTPLILLTHFYEVQLATEAHGKTRKEIVRPETVPRVSVAGLPKAGAKRALTPFSVITIGHGSTRKHTERNCLPGNGSVSFRVFPWQSS